MNFLNDQAACHSPAAKSPNGVATSGSRREKATVGRCPYTASDGVLRHLLPVIKFIGISGFQEIPVYTAYPYRVLFGKYSGTEIKIDGTEYLMLKEDDILGVVEK
jgi:hypothetical protein